MLNTVIKPVLLVVLMLVSAAIRHHQPADRLLAMQQAAQPIHCEGSFFECVSNLGIIDEYHTISPDRADPSRPVLIFVNASGYPLSDNHCPHKQAVSHTRAPVSDI